MSKVQINIKKFSRSKVLDESQEPTIKKIIEKPKRIRKSKQVIIEEPIPEQIIEEPIPEQYEPDSPIEDEEEQEEPYICLLYTSPSPRD